MSRPIEGVTLPTHSLVAYSVHLEDRYTRQERQRRTLAPMPGGDDMLMVTSAYLESFRGRVGSYKDTHFGRVTDITRRGRMIESSMRAGRGGMASDISDPARAAQEGTFKREPRHIEWVPVRQLVVIPPGSLTGYWFFESVGGRSLGAQYRRQFARDFTSRYPKLRPVFERIVAAELWTDYEENETAVVEQLRIVSARASQDRADQLGLGDVDGPYVELIVTKDKPQKTTVMSQLRKKLFKRDSEGLLVPRDPNLTEVSATLRIDGREREVTVDREHEFGMRIQLPTEGDQPPSDSFFYSEARAWAQELAERDDVTLPADWAQGDWQHDVTFGTLGAGDGAAGTDGDDPGADEQDPGD